MTFKLMTSAKGKWRKLDGAHRLPEIIQRIAFKDGINKFNLPPDDCVTNFWA